MMNSTMVMKLDRLVSRIDWSMSRTFVKAVRSSQAMVRLFGFGATMTMHSVD